MASVFTAELASFLNPSLLLKKKVNYLSCTSSPETEKMRITFENVEYEEPIRKCCEGQLPASQLSAKNL